MSNPIFIEEEKNLIDNLNRIDLLISKLNQKIDLYNYEFETSSSSKLKNELLEKKFDKVLDLNTYKELKKCPYFGHIVLECSGHLLDIYIGNKTIYSNGQFVVYDYRNPLCVLFYSNQTSFKYNDNTYKLKLRRKLIIEDGNLISCFEDTKDFDNIIIERKETNNSKTLTTEQNNIMRLEKNKNVFIQGLDGFGKTTTMFHRMSSLIYNHPAIKEINHLYITNDKNKYVELRKELELDKISVMNMSEYYLSRLKELFIEKELDKIKINIDNEFNKEIIDSELEKKTLNLIIKKFEDTAVEDISKYKDEFKLNKKEFSHLNIFDKYKKLEEIISVDLNYELDKIKILENNTYGWLDSIYHEIEMNICSRSGKKDLTYYKFNDTNKKDQIIKFINDLDNKINEEINSYRDVDNSTTNEYIKLTEQLSKNINTVVNTLVNNNIIIKFEEYNFKSIIAEFNNYKESSINSLNSYKEELNNLNESINNFKLKVVRKIAYNKLIKRKEELDKLIKDIEYNLFILMDIENRYIIKFEDNYNEIIKLEDKLDKNYINLLEYKKYFSKVKEFILLIYKYEKYIDINDNVSNKILTVLNILIERFNNRVKYFNFIYVELFNSICNDINFGKIKDCKSYLNDISFKYSNKYLLDTFNNTAKVVYCRKDNDLDNIFIFRLLYIAYNLGYFKDISSKYNFIYIDDCDNYSIDEINLLKNTSMSSYFNITSSDSSYLKNIGKIIDGKVYNLNINLRNTGMVTRYCNERLNMDLKESNYLGSEVIELLFVSYKDILDFAKEYPDSILVSEEEYLDYFRSNGIKCISIDKITDCYKNIIVLEKRNWDKNTRFKVYNKCLNNLVIYDITNIPDTINDLDII